MNAPVLFALTFDLSPRAAALQERDSEALNRRSGPDYHKVINDPQACGCDVFEACNAHRPDCLICTSAFSGMRMEKGQWEESLVSGLCASCAEYEKAHGHEYGVTA